MVHSRESRILRCFSSRVCETHYPKRPVKSTAGAPPDVGKSSHLTFPRCGVSIILITLSFVCNNRHRKSLWYLPKCDTYSIRCLLSTKSALNLGIHEEVSRQFELYRKLHHAQTTEIDNLHDTRRRSVCARGILDGESTQHAAQVVDGKR